MSVLNSLVDWSKAVVSELGLSGTRKQYMLDFIHSCLVEHGTLVCHLDFIIPIERSLRTLKVTSYGDMTITANLEIITGPKTLSFTPAFTISQRGGMISILF